MESRGKKEGEEEERKEGGRRKGGWRKKKGDEPPQKANLGSATGHEYHAEIDKNILLESHTQWKDKSM